MIALLQCGQCERIMEWVRKEKRGLTRIHFSSLVSCLALRGLVTVGVRVVSVKEELGLSEVRNSKNEHEPVR
jgi:hypothetical protein